MNQKYKLNIGCYNPQNRFTSRDSEVRTFDTYGECLKSYNESRLFWRKLGYAVWFATIIDPNGKEVFKA